jgi:DNA polymerase III epsilon subunit-like protein
METIEINDKPKVICLDIETSNVSMKSEGLYFGNPNGWKTSCVCIFDGYEGKGYYFVKDPESIIQKYTDIMDDDPVKKSMFNHLFSFTEMLPMMEDFFNKGYTLVTHNGNSFDLPILAKPIKAGGGNLKDIIQRFKKDNRNLDTCAYLKEKTGYRFRLQYLIKGIVGKDSSKLMDASNAPIAWNAGNYLQVLGYCMCDSIFTYEVYMGVKNNNGCFHSKVKHNKKEFYVDIEGIDW